MKKMKQQTAAGQARRGVAATELAMVLPLFMMIVLGAVDFGRFAVRSISVANAARAGAGYGIMHPFTPTTQALWSANLKQAVVDEMQPLFDAQFGTSSLTVTPVATTDPGSRWRVRVTVTFPFQTLFTWPGIPHKIDMTQVAEMRGVR